MSVEVHIPEEINKYETKLLGPFTARQVVVILIFAPIIVMLFNYVRSVADVDLASFVILFPASIAALFGWVKPYGMTFEVFLRSVFINLFIAPSKRPYVTKNYFEQYSDIVLKDDVMKKIDEELALSEDTFFKDKKKSEEEEYILEDYFYDLDAYRAEMNKAKTEPVSPAVPVAEATKVNVPKEKPKKEPKPKKEKYIKSSKAIK